MEFLDHLALGFSTALGPMNLLYGFIGVLLGTFIGVLPGLGPLATISMLLPITFSLPAVSALIMLSGIYYGSQYGGSTTAILLNLPGESSSVVTAIDGHKMALQGRAGAALAIAALGSLFAGTVSTFLIALLAPPLTEVALLFGPAEYASLMLLGLIVSVLLASGSVIKALAMIALGVLLGLAGQDIYTGAFRFTFGIPALSNGFDFLALSMGVFGLGEIMRNLEGESTRTVAVKKVKGLFLTRDDVKRVIAPVLRGTALGSFLGLLPGGGAVLSSFASYSLEKRVAKDPSRFGQGAIEGVAGPESANNAGAQTSFIPMLTLGIPSNPVMALMIGALILNGITPGPNVIRDNPELFWGLIASMWIGNIMLVILNLPLVNLWVRLLTVPYRFIFPAVGVLCCVGVYSVNNNPTDVMTMAVFGLVGFVLIKFEAEPAPLMLGFVVGPMLEENVRRAMLVGRGDPSLFFTHPISLVLLIITALALASILLPSVRKTRDEAFIEEE